MMKTVKVGNRSFSMKRVRTFSPAYEGFDQEKLTKKYPKAMSALIILNLAHQANPLKALLAVASGKRQYDEKVIEKFLSDAEKFLDDLHKPTRRFSDGSNYVVYLEGGSIGSKHTHRLGGKHISLVKEGLTEEQAKELKARYNKMLSPGEKSYYKMKYGYTTSDKIKSFSEIKSDEEFREYAHKVMKAAHGEDYSEEVTNKVVDDLLKNNQGADYGELIGRLTSGFND